MELFTHANRGNVAVICWNTLNSKKWGVTGEEIDGVNYGDKEEVKTLLAIYFPDFATTAGDLKEIESISITATRIEDRQLKLDDSIFGATDDEIKAFDFAKVPSKNKDEKSYKDGRTVYIYVPEEVCEDLDSLKNRKITLILGEDNKAALIAVEDDVVEAALLEEYDADNHKITIAGTTYKLKMDTAGTNEDVAVRTNEASATTTMTAALRAIGVDETDFDNIKKAIEATVTLDGDDKVEAIELFTSTSALTNTVEALVEEVKEGKDKYTIYLAGGKSIVVKDDFEEFPKVYIDGAKADLSDIEAGNVLTIITDIASKSDVKIDSDKIAKIYASTKVVSGEPNRVKKSNYAIEVDGTEYLRSTVISDIYTEELEKDAATTSFAPDTIMDSDVVTLYLNIFGEYVAVSVEDGVSSDYQFGIITYVDDQVDFEGDEGEIETMSIKVLAQDATKSVRYTVKADTSDDDIDDGDLDTKLTGVVYKLVMFIADGNRNIDYEDLHIITSAAAGEAITDLNDYTFFETTTVDGKKTVKDSTHKYRYSAADTVIFNTGKATETCGKTNSDGAHIAGCPKISESLTTTPCNGKVEYKPEVVSNWSNILTNATTLQNTAICVLDKDDNLVCISLLVDNDGSSDTEYAVVAEEIYTYKDDTYAKLLSENTTLTLKADKNDDSKLVLGGFISYKAPSDKIKTPTLLLDVEEFNKSLADNDKALATGTSSSATSTILPTIQNTLIKNVSGTDYFVWAENFEVESIYFDDDADNEYEIEYVEIKNTETNQVEQIDSIDLADKNTTVYDLRDGKCEEMTMKSLKALVDADGEVYVIRLVGTDNASDDDILVVLGE